MMRIIKKLKKYFPSSKAWRNSIILFIFTHATGLIALVLFFWSSIALFCSYALTFNPLALVAILQILFCYFSFFFCILLISIPYSMVLGVCKLLFGNSVKLLDPALETSENINCWFTIITFSSFPLFLIQFISFICDFNLCDYNWYQLLYSIYFYFINEDFSFLRTALNPSKYLQFSWIWLISAAYLYEWIFRKDKKAYSKQSNSSRRGRYSGGGSGGCGGGG